MLFLSLFLTSILASISLVAGDALQKWTEIASKSRSNVIKLDEQTFDQLITTERNYTAIIALTALQPQYQCTLCREFDPEFSTVAESWRKAHPQSDGVFFGRLDFPEGRPIFFGLQSAPNVWVYPPTSGPLSHLTSNNQPLVFDFPGNGMNAEPFHKFLLSNAKVPAFPIVRPFNWQKLFVTIALVVIIGTVTKLAWPQIHHIITNKNAWAVGCLVTILMFTSGHMFNAIRHTPYISSDGRGGFSYVAGGFQNQFGVETQIMAYGLLAFTTIALIQKAPTIREPSTQFIVVFIWTSGILFIYSFLIYVFRIKNGGYPFRIFL